MEQFKRYGLICLRLFAPIGVGVAAVIGFLGGLQALVGFSPVGEKWLIAALVIFLICGAILLIQHEVRLHEYDRGLGNEHAKALWRDGIPAVHAEYLDRVRKGDYGTVNRFWSAGFVNVSDGHGTYDLHIACEGGHASIVQGLLERGADPRLPNRAGQTPLMLAAIEGRTKVAEKLFDHDCALNARSTDHGFSALHVAAGHGRFGMAELLIKEGAKIDSLDDEHLTPIMYAIVQSKWEVVELLLAAGADLSRVDSSGATLMDYAIAFRAPQTFVEQLRTRGIMACVPALQRRGTGHARTGHTRVQWVRKPADQEINRVESRGRLSPPDTQ